ncbi:MAG: helix-hairpin-helix domain-containing protein [Acidobacteriota bacterium]|nr:helix-hairpin-helix domain-containing protein [Acidobacteriota bacterium]
MMMDRATALKKFQDIPNVGPRTAEDLWRLGFRSPSELKGQDPQAMYEQLCDLKGVRIDRCQLYVFRSVVYFASRKSPQTRLLKWWAWKDRTRI